jgi:hypothetical protein
MSAYAVRTALPDDDAGILRLVGAPQPSTGLTLGFERAPSYFLSAQVSHESPDVVVATLRDGSDSVVAVVNMGTRQVFVNGEMQAVVYGSDMRIDPAHQGGRLLVYFNRPVKERLGETRWFQTVILKENARSRATFDQGGRAGIPIYFPQQSVVTYTLTGLSPTPVQETLAVRQARAADVPTMNAFIRAMAAHYQFLPAYDFHGVERGDSYYRGLRLEDFLLVERDGALCALGGLWRQKDFKQTRVLGYQPALAWLRPFYNLWTRWRGGLRLPAPGGTLDYLMAHSALSAPADSDAFAALMTALWQRLRANGGQALCLSLADNDPRRAVLRRFRHHAITGTHYLATYNPACLPVLDASRIAYFECGRL